MLFYVCLKILYLKCQQDYLTEQSLSKEDLVQKCLQKMDAKEYSTIGKITFTSSWETPIKRCLS